MSDEQTANGRHRRRRRGRGGHGDRPQTPVISGDASPALPRPDRHQRLAAFQVAVAAHTQGLDDADLDSLLYQAAYFVERSALRLRHAGDTIPVPRTDLEHLAEVLEQVVDEARDSLCVERWQLVGLEEAIRDVLDAPDGGEAP